ncbi:SGNH/GDSL hydrolase family protein [Sphingobium boeckii]|uniref:Lysophospholipase L1-like esterase n=1 Tax=Sphingobium boeckii TaxID=1082345 RepID=A0A7W9ECQ5_9SPHN|nr:SGNH/GDSL hydrolase family protein [Sphingobium boeckii]MBB5684302.1 lysophospholipase L1-like esterase [Sphingobium boeckii]
MGGPVTQPVSAAASASSFGRPPKIVVVGDSIAAAIAGNGLSSPWFWAQVRKPRLYAWNNKGWDGSNDSYNLARSGSWSGATTGHAATTTFGTNTPDMNTALVRNAVNAISPDICVIEIGTNDRGSTAYNETFANVKSFVGQTNAKKYIVVSILPRASSAGNYMHTNALYRYWQTVDSRIHYMDLYPEFLDDTSATNGLIGGAGGGATAVTFDGLHPSTFGARAARDKWDVMMDILGVPVVDYIAVGQIGNYNASDQPYGNLVGDRGAFIGTSGGKGTGVTGNVATGWDMGGDGSGEITCVAAKDTIVVDGVTHVAQKLTFTATTTLTQGRSVSLGMGGGGFASPGAGILCYASALVQIENLIGCNGFMLQLNGATLGGYDNNTGAVTPAANLVPTVTEILKMRYPGTMALPSGAAGMPFLVSFNKGVTAGALGSIKIAQAGVWPLPATLP